MSKKSFLFISTFYGAEDKFYRICPEKEDFNCKECGQRKPYNDLYNYKYGEEFAEFLYSNVPGNFFSGLQKKMNELK